MKKFLFIFILLFSYTIQSQNLKLMPEKSAFKVVNRNNFELGLDAYDDMGNKTWLGTLTFVPHKEDAQSEKRVDAVIRKKSDAETIIDLNALDDNGNKVRYIGALHIKKKS